MSPDLDEVYGAVRLMKPNSQAPLRRDDFLQWGVPRLLGAGYGLFSRKAISPRWPEIVITAAVIGKYRKKSSFWFMLTAATRGVARHAKASGELQAVLARLVGSTPRQLQQLAGIYEAMRFEQGTAAAIACVVEIVRITNEKRKHRLTWYRRLPARRAVAAKRGRQRHKTRGK
ncbi:MAG: hypothetical protein OHK0011_18960 [Turneriella sp.]